jgi:hypothetical protein
VQGVVERLFNNRHAMGDVPSDRATARQDTIRAAEIIRRKLVAYLRGRNVYVITDGRKFGGKQSYPFLVSTSGDDGRAELFLIDFSGYQSATGALIAKDIKRPMRELAQIGANTRTVTTDNCSNLVAALRRLAERLLREMQSATGAGVIHTRCADHTALLALDDVIEVNPTAAAWLAALKAFSAFLARRRVVEALRTIGVIGSIPRFLDAKWVANLDLSHFLTIWRKEIEQVRSGMRRGPTHMMWRLIR